MLITKASLDAIFYRFSTAWQAAYDETPSFYKQIATESPSEGRETHYAWMGRMPALRKWIGERKLNNLQARGYVIVNDKFEDTISVPRENIEDDQIGVFQLNSDGLGRAAKVWPDQIMATLIEAGTTQLGFDGQPFFTNAHPIDMDNSASSTYQNNFANSGTGGSAAFALSATNYATMRAAMMNYVGEDNVKLGIVGDVLMVPPQLEATARQILHADFVAPTGGFGMNAAQAQSNVFKGSADLLVNPFLTQADAWYLLCTKRAIKPFVWQLRSAPEFTYLTKAEDANVFLRDEYLYGVRARGNAGFSLPFLAARGSATT